MCSLVFSSVLLSTQHELATAYYRQTTTTLVLLGGLPGHCCTIAPQLRFNNKKNKNNNKNKNKNNNNNNNNNNAKISPPR